MTNLKVARAMLDFQSQTVFHAILCWSLFSSKQCVIKQLLDSVFVISEIIKLRPVVTVTSLDLRLGWKRLPRPLLVRISQKLHSIIVY